MSSSIAKTFPPLYKAASKGGKQIWQISVEPGTLVGGGVSDTGVIVIEYGLEGGKMQEQREEIRTGKNYGRRNATTPYQQALNEAQARWEKQLSRKGYGLTVEQSKATRAISPMLAQTYGKHAKKVEWGSAFAQPKLDGFRTLARLGKGGKVIMHSRENQPMLALSHIADVLNRSLSEYVRRAGGDVILDGEAYCHGMPLQTISSACKKRSDLTDQIQYYIYDAMLPEGGDFKKRATLVRDLIADSESPVLVGVETVKVRNETELMTCQADFIAQGYEGAMLRHSSAPYQAGKRSAALLKVKTFQDDEFVVEDYKLGRNDLTIFVCTTKDGHTFDVLAPGTVEQKKAYAKNGQQYVGKKLTVKFAYYTQGAEPVPFQPIGMRFRG